MSASRIVSTGSFTPLRIAHVMAGAPTGGAELFYERLCRAQQEQGHTVQAILRRDAGRQARLVQGGVQITPLRFGGRLDLLTRPRMKRALTTFRPDMVVAWMSRAARLVAEGDWPVAGRLGGYYDLGNYRRCTDLIGNTRGLARWMIAQGWPAEHVHYVPNFADDLADVRPIRPSCVPAGRPYVLALGRLHKNKAFDVLIRAMVHLEGIHLVIAGEGPEREALTALARTEGVKDRVHLPGWIQKSGGWLRSAALLACPSRIEPLGNVVIEAFSAGCPVVASAIQGPEELIAGTRDGLLVPVEDHRALAAAMADILDSPGLTQDLSVKGRARFEKEFSAPTVLARWDDFLRERVR